MKTPISYSLLALTLFLAATTWSVQGQVTDMNGDIIFRGSYYVLPFVRGQGGGVTLAGLDGNPCPLHIVQESSELDKGLPVKFSNWLARVPFVPLNANLNIETDVAATICMQPTYWWIQHFSSVRKDLLTTGPKPEGDPSDVLTSFFQIDKTEDENVYKIVFCPLDFKSNGKASNSFCVNVGIYVDGNGVRRLGVGSDEPFLVQFKKAEVIESVLSKNM